MSSPDREDHENFFCSKRPSFLFYCCLSKRWRLWMMKSVRMEQPSGKLLYFLCFCFFLWKPLSMCHYTHKCTI